MTQPAEEQPLQCPNCGTGLLSGEDPRQRFCRKCGASLSALGLVSPRQRGEGAAPESQVRSSGESEEQAPVEGSGVNPSARAVRGKVIGLGVAVFLVALGVGALLHFGPSDPQLPTSIEADLFAADNATDYVARLNSLSSTVVRSANSGETNELIESEGKLLQVKVAVTQELRSLPALTSPRAAENRRSRTRVREALSLIALAAESRARSTRALGRGLISIRGFAKASPDEGTASDALDASSEAGAGVDGVEEGSELLERAETALLRSRSIIRGVSRTNGVDDQQIQRRISAIGTDRGSTDFSAEELRVTLENQETDLKTLAEELEPEPSSTLVQCGATPFDKATDPITNAEADACAVHEIVRSQYYSDPGRCSEGCPINVASVDTFTCQPPSEPIGGPEVEGGYLVRCVASDPRFYIEFYWGS